MTMIRMPNPLKCLCALLLFAIPGGLSVQAAPPEISNVFPDFPTEYPNASPHLVTGEGFEPGKTEVWVWSPGNEAAAITNALAGLGEAEPILPTQPPPDARRVATLDVERQVLVAPLEGVVVWVRTASGASKPCLFNVPKPCWLGPERAEPGASVHVFGFGLRAPWQAPRLALKGAERHYLLAANPPSRDYRAEDSTLLYFDVPANALPGNYDVFVHNGNGGALGWRKAGLLEIIAPAKIPEKLFNVRDYGAKGDDEGNDYLAIAEAMAAAKSAASNASVRAVVYFPPGKFRTDTTLEVPSGVTLRGASRDLSVVEGFGVLPPDRHTTALVHPAPQTTIESLTFQGFTVKGPGAYWMAMINPPPPKGYNPRAGAVSDFTLRNCRLLAGDSQSSQSHFAYLQALAGAARVETAQAQVETAHALYQKAVARQQAGVAAAIDTLRAQVEYQARQQQLISATNDFAKQKLSLARVIGLAAGQEFELADKAPYEAFPIPDLETALQRAYSLRADYKAARARLLAAQLERSAATAGYFPTIDMAVNFDEIGKVPGDVLPTYGVVGTLNIPIFQGGRVHGDVLKAEAKLRQAQAQMEDVRGQIDQDIRNALLDLKSSSDRVEVARSSVDLAEQALTQSQDRFSAGITDNLEVIQAQEAVASAHENFISSLYLHNVAKVSYARALGRAEEGVREYLKGK